MNDLIYLISDLNTRRTQIQKFDAYYAGNQPVNFVGAKLQSEFGLSLSSLSCNRCGPVVDAIADRLQVESFEDRGASDVGALATAYWFDNDLDLLSGQVTTEALVTGDSFLIAWPDSNGKVVLFPQQTENMAVLYDLEKPNTISVAAKAWQTRDKKWRINLYYADRLEKYASNRAGSVIPDTMQSWEKHQDDADDSWPLTYDFNGLVPVFHFAANSRAGGSYGKSELKDILPLQDRLNQTLANLAISEEFQSYRQRWATGIQVVLDEETGDPISPFKSGSGADRLWIASEEGVKFGEFGASDLTMFEAVLEGHEVRIARTARIPLHYLIQSGTPPSGESLKTSESAFVAKIVDRQRDLGSVWARILDFILGVQGIESRLKTVWKNAESRSEKEFWDHAAIKRELGVSYPQILREAGYADEQIDRFPDEQRLFDATMNEALVRALNSA